MSRLVALLPLLLIAGACVDPDAVRCSDGDLCPAGTVCASVTNPDQKLCADPAQLTACENKPDYTHCMTNGRCYAGVCLPVACGNGRVDRPDPDDPLDLGEACDDTNQTAGDGCSADCKSDETCGNGYVDPITGELCDDGNLVDHDACDSRCKPEQPQWTQIIHGPPSARAAFAFSYDAARGRTIMFGGAELTTGAVLDDTWEWNGAAWSLVPTVSHPSARSGAQMVYYAATHTVILYGGVGENGTFLSDTWAWDGKQWTPLVSATNPGRRSGHAMAYDGARHRIVMFGGTFENAAKVDISNDTWEWTSTGWMQIVPAMKPPATQDPAMAYDAARGVIVEFDGMTTDVWEYNGTTWRNITPPGQRPVQRSGHFMAWDPFLGRVILFGGIDTSSNPLADTWTWNGQAWTPLTPMASPPARSMHALATDPERSRIVLWGGSASNDPDAWEWDGSLWVDITSGAPRAGQLPGTFDTKRSRGTVLDSASVVWQLDGRGWHGFPPTGTVPAPGGAPSLAYDSARAQLILFGGLLYDARTWLWDGTGWTALTLAGPKPRSDAMMAYDAARDRTVLFGGLDINRVLLDDTWEWDGTSWTPLDPATKPPPLADAMFGYDPIRRELVLHGGSPTSGVVLDDTWTWDGTTWTLHDTPTAPGRSAAAMAWNGARRRMVLFGGSTTTWLNDTWEWDGSAWTSLPIALAPPPRSGAALFPMQGGVGLQGGSYGTSIGYTRLGDTWELRWEGSGLDETCRDQSDLDGDGLAGCADADCWQACSPLCPPGTDASCAGPRCGDGACSATENCRICPGDCACKARCGDLYCDPPETITTCPGDCTP